MAKKRSCQKAAWKAFFLIQSLVFLYSLVSMLSKIASNVMQSYGFWSFAFIGLFGGMVLCLGVYAILWQQVLKKVDLISAYVHKSTTLLWSLLWSATMFRESIAWNNIVGVIVVIIGIILVTHDD